MAKKVGVSLMGIFMVLFIGVSLFSYYTRQNPNSAISGMIIGDVAANVNISLVAFILQWVILLVVVIFGYMRFLKHRKEEEEKIANFVIPAPKTEAETNIDAFYTLLQDKKSLTTGTVAKAFKITKEQALDWGKILEEHALVTIEYPAFADPEIKIPESKEEKEKRLQKEKEKKEAQKNKKTKSAAEEINKNMPDVMQKKEENNAITKK